MIKHRKILDLCTYKISLELQLSDHEQKKGKALFKITTNVWQFLKYQQEILLFPISLSSTQEYTSFWVKLLLELSSEVRNLQ